jgi:hypothetical protein
MIFNAGMGCFNRAAIVTGEGAVVGDGQTAPTPEQIHQQWDAINNLGAAKEQYNLTAALAAMLDAFAPKGQEDATGSGMTVKGVFDRMPEAFRPEKAAGVDVVKCESAWWRR